MKSKTNNRTWTTVAIGRPEYTRLRKAAQIKKVKMKRVINELADGWSQPILELPPLPPLTQD